MEDTERDHRHVRVTNAPGYADFDGVLLMSAGSVDHRGPLAVVGFEWGGKRDFAVVPSDCVTIIDNEGT